MKNSKLKGNDILQDSIKNLLNGLADRIPETLPAKHRLQLNEDGKLMIVLFTKVGVYDIVLDDGDMVEVNKLVNNVFQSLWLNQNSE